MSTLYDKIWQSHCIEELDNGACLLYVDTHLLHEGSRNAFHSLLSKGRKLRRPAQTFGFADHWIPTESQEKGAAAIENEESKEMVLAQVRNSATAGFKLFGLGDPGQGIVHVSAPEQGIIHPGMVVVCGDSHTCTLGALGALAFGVGASEVEHVMATQCLWQRKSKTFGIDAHGALAKGVFSKDLILAIIRHIGSAGGVGYALEFFGECIRGLSIEERMTLCNMSIEAGAKSGIISPDQKLVDYLQGKPYAPGSDYFAQAAAQWLELATTDVSSFDKTMVMDASTIEPMVTWGTSVQEACPIRGRTPKNDEASHGSSLARLERSLQYMGMGYDAPLEGLAIDRVFIGSCTNSRLSDLRIAAGLLKGRRVKVRTLVVPGSWRVRQAAEAEGLDKIFEEAGCEWRQPGCSMCIAVNGDMGRPGERCVSTSNRNFEGRQGQGVRTHLASPATAAASAAAGVLVDPREFLQP